MKNNQPPIPEEILEALRVPLKGDDVILDRKHSLIEFFQRNAIDKYKNLWEVIKAYNSYLFDRVDLLKTKINRIEASNEYLRTELKFLLATNAEYITILKMKGVNTHAISQDVRKKLKENAGKKMEESEIASASRDLTI